MLARAREGDSATALQVVMEPTGMAWFPIAVFFARRAVSTYLVNSQEVADLRRYYQRHAKRDRIDTRVLVSLRMVNPEKQANGLDSADNAPETFSAQSHYGRILK